MKKILIVNAVPVNNGDAALVFGLYDAIKSSGNKVSVASYRFKTVKDLYPDKDIVRDLLDYPLVKKSRIFKYILIPFYIIMLRHYREADIIVGAPGGYINSYYGVFDKLYVQFICKLFKKKVAIYSQSIGPLNKKDRESFSCFAKYFDLIYARDHVSYDTAVELLNNVAQIRLTEDAAFLLEPEFRKVVKKQKKIAVSVRAWNHDSRNSETYYVLVAELVKLAISRGYVVDFISTCQGVAGYIDDSVVAKRIVDSHLKGFNGVTVKDEYYNLDEFRKVLQDYEFVVGTRLHMCILGMLNGLPAFNLSYEIKGLECYSYLGIQDLSVDYNEDYSIATLKFGEFIDNIEHWKDYIRERIVVSHSTANKQLQQFLGDLEI